LDEVAGQLITIESLTKVAKRNAFNHAYMLAGQFGTGKTTVGRILACLMTCEKRQPGSDKCCGRCRSCLAIHEGYSIDVSEIDGGSDGGIERIRSIKKEARISPQELNRKIYIIDECHGLSADAKKSLLKILEEPPKDVVFILCTSEIDKVPGAILSRCQRYNFTKIPTDIMAERLLIVAKNENVELDADAATTIAKMASGSLRDAFGYLEQISIFSDDKVSGEEASRYFGSPDKRLTYKLAEAIADQNLSGLIHIIDSLIAASVNPKAILSELSDILRNVTLLSWCKKDLSMVDAATEEEQKTLIRLAEKMGQRAILNIARSFSRVDKQISTNINDRWVLEAALINCVLIINSEAQSTTKGP
jgi:DNA polymerase-3 subunit gamma/tau